MKFINQKIIQLISTLFLFSILFTVIFSASCSLQQQTKATENSNILLDDSNIILKPNLEKSELERNRNLWRERNIINYKMVIKLSVTGLYNPISPVEILVENGKAISIKTFEKPARNPAVESYERFGNNTVETMFEKIESAEMRNADKLEVKYDAKFGYPKEISIDSSFAVIDDESYVKVEKFEVTN